MKTIHGSKIYTKDGRVAKGGKALEMACNAAYAAFDAARTRFAIECTRDAYNDCARAGADLVAFQEANNVWLIHPANATPGLRADDPRIAE